MEKKQLDVLRNSKNVELLSSKIEAKDVIRQAIQKYPAYFNKQDIDALRTKTTESRYRYVVDKFKTISDGYTKLFTVLMETGHSEAVMRILRPGLTVKVKAPPPRVESPKADGIDQDALLKGIGNLLKSQEERFSSRIGKLEDKLEERISSKFDDLKATMEEEMKAIRNDMKEMKQKIDKIDKLESLVEKLQIDITSGRSVTSDLEKVVKQLCTELNEVKNKMKDMEKRQSIDSMSQKLQAQGEKDVIRDLEGVKSQLRQLKLWMERQCGMMSYRIGNLERENTGRKIARDDVKTIAVKIQTQWEVIAKEVGIEGETIKHSHGKQILDSEAAAEAFISKWIEMGGKESLGTGVPPTYDALYEIVRRRDEKIAEEIKELQNHSKK